MKKLLLILTLLVSASAAQVTKTECSEKCKWDQRALVTGMIGFGINFLSGFKTISLENGTIQQVRTYSRGVWYTNLIKNILTTGIFSYCLYKSLKAHQEKKELAMH